MFWSWGWRQHSRSHSFFFSSSSSPSSPCITSTVSTSSPSCRDDILITTELSALSDTISSMSWTAVRRIGERRWVGEGGGTGTWKGQNFNFFHSFTLFLFYFLHFLVSVCFCLLFFVTYRKITMEIKHFLYTVKPRVPLLTPPAVWLSSHLWTVTWFVRFSQFGECSLDSCLLRHLECCLEHFGGVRSRWDHLLWLFTLILLFRLLVLRQHHPANTEEWEEDRQTDTDRQSDGLVDWMDRDRRWMDGGQSRQTDRQKDRPVGFRTTTCSTSTRPAAASCSDWTGAEWPERAD